MSTAIKEKALRCTAEEARSILDGRKTQARCVGKFAVNSKHLDQLLGDWGLICSPWKWSEQDENEFMPHYGFSTPPDVGDWVEQYQTDVDDYARQVVRGPFGQPGDRLWVQESFATPGKPVVAYREGGECGAWLNDGGGDRIWLPHGHIMEAPGYPFGLKSIRTFGISKYGGKWKPSPQMPRWASRITLEITDVRVERLNDISEEDAKAEGVDPGCLTCGQNCLDSGGCGCCQPAYRESFAWRWQSMWDANPWIWAVTFRRVDE